MARLQEMAMSRGNRMLLFLALGAGLVAAVLVFVALSQNNDDGGTVSGGGSTSVVVANQDIDAGTVIASDMVEMKAIPDDELINGASTDTTAVVGEAARVKIYKGEQLAAGKVGAENDVEGAAGVVPPGMRGFAVGVEEVRAVGGLLRPGNRVDVYVSGTQENDPSIDTDDVAISLLILQDIEVLAVAQQAQEPSAQVDSENSSSATTSGQVPDNVDEEPDANSVTLAVTAEQAANLVCAQANDNEDRVWLSLRGYGEPPAEQKTVFDVCGQQF